MASPHTAQSSAVPRSSSITMPASRDAPIINAAGPIVAPRVAHASAITAETQRHAPHRGALHARALTGASHSANTIDTTDARSPIALAAITTSAASAAPERLHRRATQAHSASSAQDALTISARSRGKSQANSNARTPHKPTKNA